MFNHEVIVILRLFGSVLLVGESDPNNLHDMLAQPGREKYTTVISPTFEPLTVW